MNEENISTPDKILKAAEDEFIEKGYGNARMMSIAARAGVSHSMLHYYYRSKEELFQKVFNSKIELISSILYGLYDENESFLTIVRKFAERQFDECRKTPGFLLFMVRDIIPVPENLKKVVALAEDQIPEHLEHLQSILDKESAKGKIRKINILDLMLDVISINASSFIAIPVLRELSPEIDIDKFLENRKKSNVDFLLASLRPSADADRQGFDNPHYGVIDILTQSDRV